MNSLAWLCVLTVFGLSADSFGMGSKPPQELEYSAFQGHFQLTSSDKKCASLLDFEFVTDPSSHRVTMKFSNGENWVGQFERINEGKVPFNSCYSDGFIGYRETSGSGTKITEKTVILNPGFMCQGGSVKERKISTVELTGNTVTLDMSDSRYEDNEIRCIFKRS